MNVVTNQTNRYYNTANNKNKISANSAALINSQCSLHVYIG